MCPPFLPCSLGGCQSSKIDIIFLVDTSRSVKKKNVRHVITFIKKLLSEAEIDQGVVQVGMATFSTNVHIHFHLNSHKTKAQILAAVDNITFAQGDTNTASALFFVRKQILTAEKGDRPEAKNVIIVITDGVSNVNTYRTVVEAQLAREAGAHIFAIGVGLAETTELHGIASHPPEDNTFTVANFSDLVEFETLTDRLFELCGEFGHIALTFQLCLSLQI